MKELTPAMLIALVVTAAYLYVLIRDRSMSMRKFPYAQLCMPIGAIAALLFVWQISSSGRSDIGTPVDVIILLGVAPFGAVGLVILVCTAQSLPRKAQ